MEQRLVTMSRFLSYLLRHRPESEGIAMDEHGWVLIDELLRSRGAISRGLNRAALERVVADNDKRRFEVFEVGTGIRVRQGHSLIIDLS